MRDQVRNTQNDDRNSAPFDPELHLDVPFAELLRTSSRSSSEGAVRRAAQRARRALRVSLATDQGA
jgi:hypothetical protein